MFEFCVCGYNIDVLIVNLLVKARAGCVVIYVIKHINIDLLKGMTTAERINLMVDIFIDPCVVII